LRSKISLADILDLFSEAPPSLIRNPRFNRLLARLNLMSDRYPEAHEILKNAPTEKLSEDEMEELIYLKSLSEVALGRHAAGIQILADYLRNVPDRPYLLMQLDLWLLRYLDVSDPLRLKRAEDRLRAGKQLFFSGSIEPSFIPLYLARKLNPRDKFSRRYLGEVAWQMGLAETSRKEVGVALDLDPFDDNLRRRGQSLGVDVQPTDVTQRRTYSLYVFRLFDDAHTTRPSFGRLITDALALFAEALTSFQIQALEPAVPFEKAEEVAHQKGADFFLHGDIGLDPEKTFSAEFGIFPIGGYQGGFPSLELKEQHVAIRSRSDFMDELILVSVRALQDASAQFTKVVKKEREGYLIVDVGRRHGLNSRRKFTIDVLGGPLRSDVINIYEWHSRVRVQEIERVRYVGIGDYFKQILP